MSKKKSSNPNKAILEMYKDLNPSTLIAHGYIRLYISSLQIENKETSFELPIEVWSIISKYYECEQILFTCEATGGQGGKPFSYLNDDNYALSGIKWGIHNMYEMESLFIDWVKFNGNKIKIDEKKRTGFPPKKQGSKVLKEKKTILSEHSDIEWCIGAFIHYGSEYDGIRCIEFISNLKQRSKRNKKKLEDKYISVGINSAQRKKYRRELKMKEIRMPTKWFKIVGITGNSDCLIDKVAFVFKGPKFLADRLGIRDYGNKK